VAIPVFGIPLNSRFITSSPYTSYNTYNDPLTNTTSPSTSTNFSYGISATIDWTTPWDGIHVKSITADRRYHGAFAEDNFDAPITANMFSNRVFHHQFSQEEQISGKLLNETLEWVIGGYYLHISDFNSGVVDQGASGPQNKGILFYTGDPAVSDDGSAFVHLNYRATDKLSFELGGRYSDQSKTYQFYRYLPNLTGVVPAGTFLLNTSLRPASGYLAGFDPPLPGGEIKSSRVDPKLGVQYQWTPDLMTYFQYSTGFKSGGFNPRPLTPAQVTTFAPETLDAYEVGVKSEWFERRLRGNLTGFVSEYKGLQLPVLTLDKSGTPANLVQSVGRARIKGIEFEMEARPTQELAFNGSIGYLDYKALDLAGAAYDPVNNTSGPVLSNVAPLTPKLKVNVGAQYGFDFGSFGTLTPRVDYTYTSKIYYDAQNSPISAQNGYGLVNLRLHWMSANSHWESSLAVSNATSQVYYANKANSLGNYNVVTGVPGRPREVLFTIKRFF
jgi:iron complex outermembrane receptor protein